MRTVETIHRTLEQGDGDNLKCQVANMGGVGPSLAMPSAPLSLREQVEHERSGLIRRLGEIEQVLTMLDQDPGFEAKLRLVRGY